MSQFGEYSYKDLNGKVGIISRMSRLKFLAETAGSV
jgi:hypothetical protein